VWGRGIQAIKLRENQSTGKERIPIRRKKE
jgi:hypothetical protein